MCVFKNRREGGHIIYSRNIYKTLISWLVSIFFCLPIQESSSNVGVAIWLDLIEGWRHEHFEGKGGNLIARSVILKALPDKSTNLLTGMEMLQKDCLATGHLWVKGNGDYTLPKTNSSPLKIRPSPQRKFIFQPSIFGGELLVSGRVLYPYLLETCLSLSDKDSPVYLVVVCCLFLFSGAFDGSWSLRAQSRGTRIV